MILSVGCGCACVCADVGHCPACAVAECCVVENEVQCECSDGSEGDAAAENNLNCVRELSPAPNISGTLTHPAYMIRTCWIPNITSCEIGGRRSTGLAPGGDCGAVRAGMGYSNREADAYLEYSPHEYFILSISIVSLVFLRLPLRYLSAICRGSDSSETATLRVWMTTIRQYLRDPWAHRFEPLARARD